MKQRHRRGTSFRFLSPLLLLAAASVTGGLLTGCTGAFEDMRDSWNDYWNKPDPMKVVMTTDSGDRRAKFLACVKEPAQHGGSQKDQDDAVNFLVLVATKDPSPTCRLQAIRALGTYKDPRAVSALEASYYQATSFPAETNNLIKQHALAALGQTNSPTGRKLLLDVARAGAPELDKQERQLTLDERLAAIRSLQNYRDAEVTQTLVNILKTEKDVALRDRTHQTLEVVTGKHLPTDTPALEQAVLPAMATSPAPVNQAQPTATSQAGTIRQLGGAH